LFTGYTESQWKSHLRGGRPINCSRYLSFHCTRFFGYKEEIAAFADMAKSPKEWNLCSSAKPFCYGFQNVDFLPERFLSGNIFFFHGKKASNFIYR
jgi:hypothetical protein